MRKEGAVTQLRKLLWDLHYFCPIWDRHKPAAGLRICTVSLAIFPTQKENSAFDSAHFMKISAEAILKIEVAQAIADHEHG